MILFYCIISFVIAFLLFLDYKKGMGSGFKGQEEMKLPYTIDYYILKVGLVVFLLIIILLLIDEIWEVSRWLRQGGLFDVQKT